MQSKRFSTHGLSKSSQLDAWREWYAASYEVSLPDSEDNGFAAESEMWTLNGLGIARVSAPALRASRTKILARRDPVDHVCLTMGLRAGTCFTFGAETLEAPAGTPFIFGLDEAHTSQRLSDERWQIYIGRDQFRQAMPSLDASKGKLVDTPLGDLLAGYLRLLIPTLPSLSEEEAHRLPDAIVAMIVACVAPSAQSIEMAQASLRMTRLEKVRRAILQDLFAPDLDVNKLSKRLGISRSNLYRLLEPEGGVANYIKHLRLLESFEQLSDPLNTQSIGEIAEALRMPDRSSFGRSFRRKFGMTPGEVREAARAGANAILAPAQDDSPATRSFRKFLQEL
ncbi:MAG: helix-turn-helix domain-containing protein [Beijerinckiaceae bacterium]